ncbi:BrnT family toxin [Phyllobacterium endophyticum]|uniref:BrnT family toxin n=1 Tax=Phyllobacterium endophyticum TaxID=1149773 RepID=UPI0011CBB95B|nr:BrnT family toxin [Phyllobacterium endophyticum]TXR49829.1 BrnT family toxin [Phyllobacterium endophyticum]
MEFEWDEDKRRQVKQKHGVDLLYAALIFRGPVLTKRDDRADYGEERFISLGMVEDECFIVVHTSRNEVTRLITAWKGGQLDEEQYQARITR